MRRAAGAGSIVARDSVTHEVKSVYKIGEPPPAGNA